MRVLVLIAMAVALALGLGGWSAKRALGYATGPDSVAIGPWRADPLAGSVDASPYEKARLSQIGDLTLGIGEGVQFRAATDSAGAPLRRECDYRLAGDLPLARVWTIAPFTPEGRLIQPDGGRPGWLVSRGLMRREDNSVVVAVGPRTRSGNWIAVDGDGPFTLVVTLYDTPASSSTGLSRFEMLRIEAAGCSDV